ncbi:Eukaryotic translation initiation factor 6 [Penicillium chermesinum]|uniref:Eukaryotic translation initiation factor 6 n=1 Tax=Penicillium chermesinum TaxID=63820 RepID=A0A9W9TMJ4_9EURO|nr:Eukaryotic translation initiation factor 6 [Penicillium chermesinum]KAJ5232026.1 Eukaryotic translation initiation factor 6 [Penicillium chermesinum]
MAVRAQFENSNEVGVFSRLTNSYAIVAVGASENFYSVFESELQDVIPICHATIAGTRIVGRLTVGYVLSWIFSFLPSSYHPGRAPRYMAGYPKEKRTFRTRTGAEEFQII